MGIFDSTGTREIDRAVLDRMNQSQVHRGPDESGIHTEPGVGLGHRRLSIIDLKSGQQPLYSEDRTAVVVYNGEIYNFNELRDELVRAGHRFRTKCDTEVIIYAWREWGEQCVTRFRGMFSFALWDRRRQRLFLARDRLGIKPLYYSVLDNGLVAFSSELKGLLKVPGLSREIDRQAVEDYFAFGYIPDPKTIFKSTAKLEPGCTLSFRRGQREGTLNRYWDVQFCSDGIVSERQALEEVIPRVREAVSVRMVSEVPLGAFLSGGVDSSAVVAMMAESSRDPIITSSISFGDPNYNESAYAQRVSDIFRTDHNVEQVDPDDSSLVDRLADMYDEPFADSSAIPTFRVCALARKHVTVALSGDGGDEIFAGYLRYRWHASEERIRRLLPQWIRGPLFGALGAVYPGVDWFPKHVQVRQTLKVLSKDTVSGYFSNISLMSDSARANLFSDTMRRELQGYSAIEILREHVKRAPDDHPVSMVQYLDFKTYLPGDILTKVDRASMANSLEVRVPLLDHPLVEWACALSPNLKFNSSEGKYILKKSLEQYFPMELLYRRKMGFAVPLAKWFRGALKERLRDALLGPALRDSTFFNQKRLTLLFEEHVQGVHDHSTSLWALLMFDAFYRNQICAGDQL